MKYKKGHTEQKNPCSKSITKGLEEGGKYVQS